MSLPDILLSLLREPTSGTDLIGLFRGTFNHFWSTDLSQIYRALETLEREGCLRSKSVPSAKGPPRKVYELTKEGRSRLESWIRREPRIPGAKLEYLAQLFSVTADERPRERAREIVESIREEAGREVALLEAIDGQFRQAPGYPEAMPSFLFYPWLTLRHGLLRRRALVEWIDECLQLLERRPGPTGQDHDPDALSELVGALRYAAEQAQTRPSPETGD